MHRNLLLNLLRAVYWYADAMQINMAAQGYTRLTRATSFLLLNVAQGEHRAGNIARNLGISRQAVSAMLTDLCNRGVLVTREDPASARSRIVEFSPAFAEQGAICAEIMSKLEVEISRRVGSADFKAMMRSLEFNWGATPRFARLSSAERKHGKDVWEEDLIVEPAHEVSKRVPVRPVTGARNVVALRRSTTARSSAKTSANRRTTRSAKPRKISRSKL